MSLPLYDLLNQNISEKEDLTVIQKTDFMERVKTLTPENRELFYALVKYHELERSSDSKETFVTAELPYKGVYENKTVSFQLLSLPIPLRHILYKFLQKTETV